MPGEDKEHKHKVRDWWDKLDIISKFVTAGLVTLITIFGTSYLNKQQDATRSSQLYSQFMSEREKAENQVRKDMFEKVLAEFWHQPEEKACILDEIDQQLLQLELISRNFHETLDLSPLFSHVLLKIVRSINTGTLKFPADEIQYLETGNRKVKFNDKCSKKAYRRLLRNNNKLFRNELINFGMGSYNDNYQQWKNSSCNGKSELCKYKYILWKHIRDIKNYKKQRLISIAKRITSKQMESLSDVVKRIRLHVDLKKTCVDTKPNRKFIDSENCYEFMDSKKSKMGELIESFAKVDFKLGSKDKIYGTCTLEYNDDSMVDGKPVAVKKSISGIKLAIDDKTSRCFRFSVRRSYPRWNRVYVEVKTDRSTQEISADRQGSVVNKASFWVSFFDFPLADNTYLSNKERFAVVLEGMDEDNHTAELSLLYFPASYAGFKEKAFYQQRMLNTLLKDR